MQLPFLGKKEISALENEESEAEKKIEFSRKLGEVLPREPLDSSNYKSEPKEENKEKDSEKKADSVFLKEKRNRPWKDFFLDFFRRLAEKKEKSFDGALNVNLVRGEIVKYFDWQKGVFLFLFFLFLSLVILSLAYWGIYSWGEKNMFAKSTDHSQEYFKTLRQIKEYDARVAEVAAFKKKLNSANLLLEKHIYWTNFFDFLEKDTLSNIYFSSFGGDVNGSYQLSATADSMSSINAQIGKFLSDSYVRKAAVDAGSLGGEAGKAIVSFSISLIIDPSIFLKK